MTGIILSPQLKLFSFSRSHVLTLSRSQRLLFRLFVPFGLRPVTARRSQQNQFTNLHFSSRNRHAVLLERVILDAPFHVHAVTLTDVVFGQLCQAIPHRQAVPFRALLVIAVARHASAGGQRHVRDRSEERRGGKERGGALGGD